MTAVTATYELTYELPSKMTGKAVGKIILANQSVGQLR